MTTEDDFHAALDADPTDWQTRLVLGDWLEERGDPRAEGYRALGANGIKPACVSSVRGHYWYWIYAERPPEALDRKWWALWRMGVRNMGDGNTRREVEDAAALAFARLPAARRAELLATA